MVESLERNVGIINMLNKYMEIEKIENLVRIYDFYNIDQQLFIVMEYCR